MKLVAAILSLVVGIGLLVFHPSRPLYLKNRAVEVTVDQGVVLRGTLSLPRWSRKPVPGVVLVHGSGPLTRNHVRGDARKLARLGFAVLSYDKRGAGASTGVYLPGREWGDSVPAVLHRLAADAAAMLDRLASEGDVDPDRIGFFGASQAGWIIPLAAGLARRPPRFNVILSGPAVSTGVEQHYSDLTSDGTGAPRVADRAEVERRTLSFSGRAGFDPSPVLSASRIPTLWLLGGRDQSVPTFASTRVLDAIQTAGNNSHTVVVYPTVDHGLRDVDTGTPAPIWDDMMRWLRERGVLAGP